MQTRHYRGATIALWAVAILCAFTPTFSAQPGRQAQQPEQQRQAQQQRDTFSGKIMKLKDGDYALITGKTPQGQLAGHFLDDQKDAKKYAGEEVKVIGFIDWGNNLIHVIKIVAA